MGEKEEREEHPAYLAIFILWRALASWQHVCVFRISKAVGYYPALHKD